jgi:leucyl-tRNA synthetase
VNAKFTDAAGDITAQAWPQHDERLLLEHEVEIVLQVNGRVRDRMVVPLEATNEELEKAARANPRIAEFIAGKNVRKVVVVPKKLVNLVTD